MAYSDIIDALNPVHRYSFENTSVDQVGTADGTESGADFVTTPVLCEDNTYCMRTDDITDRVVLPSTTDINNSDQSRKAVAGWFRTSAIQNPPKRIYGEGDATQSFAFLMGWGNNVVFEVDCASFTLQIFGDTYLAPDRTYHLCMVFEGNGYSNELRAYLDGVEQTAAQPSDRQPDAATLPARSAGEFGDPAGTVAMGGTEVILIASINGYYAQWAIWDGADAVLTDTEIRQELFEKGAIADVTISSGTESAMQSSLSAYNSTSRPDAPLCFAIEDCTDGNFTLEATNMVFDAKASCHIRYEGNDTLTWVNIGTSNCSIEATTGGGSVIIQNRVTITITVKDINDGTVISGARAYIEADTGGDLTAGTEILNTTTNASGIATTTVDLSADQPIIGYVRKGTNSPYYKEGTISGPITKSSGLTQTVLMVRDY